MRDEGRRHIRSAAGLPQHVDSRPGAAVVQSASPTSPSRALPALSKALTPSLGPPLLPHQNGPPTGSPERALATWAHHRFQVPVPSAGVSPDHAWLRWPERAATALAPVARRDRGDGGKSGLQRVYAPVSASMGGVQLAKKSVRDPFQARWASVPPNAAFAPLLLSRSVPPDHCSVAQSYSPTALGISIRTSLPGGAAAEVSGAPTLNKQPRRPTNAEVVGLRSMLEAMSWQGANALCKVLCAVAGSIAGHCRCACHGTASQLQAVLTLRAAGVNRSGGGLAAARARSFEGPRWQLLEARHSICVRLPHRTAFHVGTDQTGRQQIPSAARRHQQAHGHLCGAGAEMFPAVSSATGLSAAAQTAHQAASHVPGAPAHATLPCVQGGCHTHRCHVPRRQVIATAGAIAKAVAIDSTSTSTSTSNSNGKGNSDSNSSSRPCSAAAGTALSCSEMIR